MDNKEELKLRLYAEEIRKELLNAIENAGSGHVGGSLSLAEILSVLYFKEMNIDPSKADDPNRDRFVLSKGHCAPAVYAALALRGYFPVSDLLTLRKIDSNLSGHIEMNGINGVDMSAGSLGQGLSVATGMALSAKTYNKDYRVYCVLGDGEIEEGQVWEAAMSAGYFKVDNLVAIVDYNKLQLDGPISDVMNSAPIDKKFEAFGWNVICVDGHSVEALSDAIELAKDVKNKPTMILADTIKGKGCSVFENKVKFHGSLPTPEEFSVAYSEINGRIDKIKEEL